jgi:hypothetical protein
MKPVGLKHKNPEVNPYTGRACGELMIAHLCLGCGHISCNRIAGDDNTYTLTCLLDEPVKLNNKIITRLTSQGIRLLTQEDKPEVLSTLYGYSYGEK